ncbi:MAG TPA: PRC-barrel domain-containing protein [Rariglobus sp.]|jgi:sporulation protein YlmC with PRC-barrel domain|nr:PRC-barrel domain-containing protein [Rariglobus sp.]
MKLKSKILTTVFLACWAASLAVRAETEPSHDKFGADKAAAPINHIEVRNQDGKFLGRIKDTVVDLSNGRIVAVLVGSGGFLSIGQKIVAVPPLALSRDPFENFYMLDVSTAVFKSAPAIDRSYWQDTDNSARIAAAYHLFGQEPYFLEEGKKAEKTAGPTKVALGPVERSIKLMGMPVQNLQNEKLGKIWGMMLDIQRGAIGEVIIISLDHSKTKSVVPATALQFNASRQALLLNDSEEEFANEPRYSFAKAANGQEAHFKEEPYKGARTTAALEQGSARADTDQTARIKRRILSAKIEAGNVEVGTVNGRITLRGRVNTDEDKRRIEEIAVNASRLELVDDQMTVGKLAADAEL